VSIGGVELARDRPQNPALVPHVLFYDIPKHRVLLRELFKDLACGERHLLLIGNQGVGKNKLVDRMLGLLKKEREYIQLHRDTSVQSLTVSVSLQAGVVTYHDSPLVRACKEGRVLMIDEADKAPLEVVCILKGLLEDGQMILSDGRRLQALPASRAGALEDAALGARTHGDADAGAEVISIHPNFRAIVLANRPGFPFLGNDFFAECGDVFSCHVVDNPDPASELQLLRSYAPSVEAHILDKFVAAFADLRGAVDGGKLAYPYSTRELVALARHLHAFPRDSPAATLDNVLAFDQHNSLAMSTLTSILHRHGIPIKSNAAAAQGVGAVRLTRQHKLPPAELVAQWHAQGQVLKARISRHVLKASTYELTTELNVPAEDPVRHRLYTFSECLASWVISEAHGRAFDCAATPDGAVHVLVSPLAIHSYYGPDYTSYSRTDLSDYLAVLRAFGSEVQAQILGGEKSVDSDFCLLDLQGH
jgi:von Willebrand factor A domain-containing protein 8